MIIIAEALNIDDFMPYGSIISPDEEISKLDDSGRNANQGTAVKISQVSKVQNLFPTTKNIREPNWNLFRCFPNEALNRQFVTESTTNTVTFSLKVLENHPYSSQTFVPMGRRSSELCYLVIVALSDPSSEPDLSTLKAFICRGTQAVTYGPGVWHAPMIVLGEPAYLDFTVLIHEALDAASPELDCIERVYPRDLHKVLLYCP
ncbi:ureidoglycolate hydrolase Ecym_7089 [Eremothecium cymbalariae DBVPG|uniref:Ureidoglycolate lyase n=1 Tax=Eremothecium cymbalariae (strain CBS 270.75 / DBVPG 7215 / KCTC 17166 / NRRL Y-17582) TaxID=931890 RepID=G8JVS6_ERECY|nr:hypothetical protein Ecym_7089 [Eremothecium cymbalariae DBVPG\